jgi:hypothetical protein
VLQVQETFEVAEMERTIEDMIEEQRAKLHAEGKKVYNIVVYMHLYYSCKYYTSEHNICTTIALTYLCKTAIVLDLQIVHI